VEFALVLPVLLLILFGIIDFGLGFNRQLQLTEAVHEGARVAALSGSPAAAEQKVRDVLGVSEDYATLSFEQVKVCDGQDTADAEIDATLYFSSPTGLGALMSRVGGDRVDFYNLRASGTMACVG
jgi:hypothetical protein